MMACIERLPPDEREIYRMCELEHRPASEIAGMMNADEATVQALLSSAQKNLKKLFFEI